MANFGPLAAEIFSLVWGTPANFNWFRVLASLLQRRRSTEANQTLHGVWPSPSRLHYTFWQLLPRNGILPGTKFSLRPPSLALSYWHVTARHSCSGREPNFAALSTGRHLYSVGRPSRWTLAHILVPPPPLLFSSLNLSRCRVDVCDTCTYGVALVQI